ncbi:hypothetical protein [Bacillus niameyensis]|uniref:hypothetical protein n=1 Tax=Bacillus niameyensis TaxID=1522308 RepID=UPI000784E505|nr:hypothetical protein [Bacillus niameyensis]
MYELLLQDTYTEWLVPLAIAAIWILSWQLFLLARPIRANGKMNNSIRMEISFSAGIPMDKPFLPNLQLIKTFKRQESPEDSEEDHHFPI